MTPRRVADAVTSAEIVEATGVTYRQVDHWVKVGVLRLDAPCYGSGTTRRFGPAEVRVAGVAATLYALGFNHYVVVPIAEAVRAHPRAVHLPVVVAVDPYVVEVTDTHVTVTAPLQAGASAGNGKRRR